MNSKSILITGSTGIIGKSLVLFLKKKKFNLVFSKGSKSKDFLKNLKKDLKSNSIDCLIHLAGKDDYNSNSPQEIKKINLKIDKQLIKVVKKFNIPFVIFSSTNRVYEGSKKKKIINNSLTIPISPYGKSKIKSEKAFSKLNLKLVILRLPSVLSKHSKKGLIYFIYKKMIKNKEVKIFNPNSLFNNVILQDDLNKAIFNLIKQKQNLPRKKIINLAALKPIKFIHLIKFMLRKIKSNSLITVCKNNKISKLYLNKDSRNLFDFKIKSVKNSINSYLNDL